ncbi:MAG: hypothetical protein QM766_10260 [Burkholderiaceae bacterium]
MTAMPIDDALDRLNYFNGQRLAAADLRTEQRHHIGMRRVLNRSLYSSGIVSGLEVMPDPTSTHRVIVGRGLAFDNQGREIFVPVDTPVQVMGTPSSGNGVVFGNLLVVSYREARQNVVTSGCTVPAGKPCSGDLAWGAPTRVVAQPVFEFLDARPADDSGKVVLAQLELSKTCDVVRVLSGVRRYAMQAKPQTVRALSLEGEKDIDHANRKDLVFHIIDGFPASVTLYLRGRTFSSLFYSETGRHAHDLALDTQDTEFDLRHAHQASGGTTDEQGEHTHSFIVDDGEVKGGIDVNSTNGDFIQGNNPIQLAGKHTHGLTGLTLSTELSDWSHHHHISGATRSTGLTGAPSRTDKPALSTFKDLTIFLDDQPITAQVCDQLEAIPGQAGLWRVEPTPGDVRMNGATLSLPDGTGEIDLLKLGIEIGLGPHTLSFRVNDADVGGQLQYNLYVA